MKKKYPDPFRREGKKIYYYHTEVGGKRTAVTTGETNKEAARAVIRQRLDAAEALTVKPEKSQLTFREYAAPFFIWKEGEKPTCPHASQLLDEGLIIGRPHCINSRRLVDRVLEKNPDFGDLVLEKIRRGDMIRLRTALNRDFPPRIAGTMLSAIKTILGEAAFQEDLNGNPGADVGQTPYKARERGALTVEEVRAILKSQPGRMGLRDKKGDVKDPRISAMFTFMLATGTRSGEVQGIRWGSVDLDTGTCKIDEAMKSGDIGLPKWEKTRSIVVAKVALEPLKTFKKKALRTGDRDFIFGNKDGDPISPQVIKDAWQTVMDDATAPKDGAEPIIKLEGRWITPHSSRHTLNSALLAAGCTPFAVAEYLGWSSELGDALTKVQAGYSHLQLIDLKKIADTIDKLYTPPAESSAVLRLA